MEAQAGPARLPAVKKRLLAARDRVLGLRSRLDRLENTLDRQLRRQEHDLKILSRRLTRLEHNVQALLRLAAGVGEDLDFPQRMLIHRFALRSQNEEDGLTLALLNEAGAATRTFAELGCGDNGGNSGFLATELGWRGLFVDAEESATAALRAATSPERVTVVQQWLERDTVNDLLSAHGLTGEMDVLGIDIDGNDYWLWHALDAVSPRLVIVEYNSMFGPDRAVVVPYDPKFVRHSFEGMKGTYYGASLRALTRLGREKGYRLVAVEPRGVNAFFLRDDVAPHVPACDPRAEYRLLDKYAPLLVRGFDPWRAIEEQKLPLLDLDAVGEPVSSRGS